MKLASVILPLTLIYPHVDSPDAMQDIDALLANLNSKTPDGNRMMLSMPDPRPGKTSEDAKVDAVIVTDQGVGSGIIKQDGAELAGPGAGTEPSERLGVDPAQSNTPRIRRDRFGEDFA
jgi:hypothetical protein